MMTSDRVTWRSPVCRGGIITAALVLSLPAPLAARQATGAPRATPAAVSPAPPLPPPAAVTPPPDARAEVLEVVSRYQQAFSERDAAAAKAVWPAVNEGQLRRAFKQLESQEITFAECQTDLDEPQNRATVTCRGSVRFVPRIGPGTERIQMRRWEFAVIRFVGRWMLESVNSVESVPAVGRYPESPLNSPITRPER